MSRKASLWSGLLFKIAKHWIAGETYQDALARAQSSSVLKIRGIVNLLGEAITSPSEASAHAEEYIEILKQIGARKIPCCISVKPTQLGLAMERSLYEQNLTKILTSAKSLGNFVWIDIESSQYAADTVDSYLRFLKNFDNVGIAIQAYLRRTERDVNAIVDSGGIIRLVKGAYNESPDVVYKSKKVINENYSKFMRILFERAKRFAVATHDDKLIDEAVRLSASNPADFEFEMLMGIRDKLKLELVERGYQVSEYIPYGRNWWNYSMRRIREHKSNVLLLARSLLGG